MTKEELLNLPKGTILLSKGNYLCKLLKINEITVHVEYIERTKFLMIDGERRNLDFMCFPDALSIASSERIAEFIAKKISA